ncbi:hypothetical protein BN7_3172 [Wickerhamomyces ciferrii]|uniref:Protein kinase domain-containing protein n=1 Tax=Wickerhamomyces ciferrii (strain ATCC 14091 / BCRC 22168 / CBS 111 / JCM 3599 / NBRC 0793 / NRRL Y-1031 F-60-10) TaxID=1206466 RepID=K0KQG3_WICCF|nr:uncharacterized protein BN7_3172 [Wickerhamomyces ciferrii]CCH43619.1 hypothetical protein BN7_3172 [Wickerhamomyces ciferrii]
MIFCTTSEDLNPKIVEKLELKEDERPKYLFSLWKIYCAANIVDDQLPNELPMTTDGHINAISDNDSIFNQSFKSIYLDPKYKHEEIKDEDLLENIDELELFIEYSLNRMPENKAVLALSTLLRTFYHFDDALHSDEQDLDNWRKDAMKNLIVNPINNFINKLLKVHDVEYSLKTFMPKRIKPKRPSEVWESYKTHSDGKYPKELIDDIMFHNCQPDFPVTLESGNNKKSVCAIEMKGKDVSGILEDLKHSDNFPNISKFSRQSIQYQIFMKLNSFMVSDFNRTIYFEYPLRSGKWESDDEEKVFFTGAPVKYKIFDNCGTYTSTNPIQLQLFLMLKFYDAFKRTVPTYKWLKEYNGKDELTESSDLDEKDNPNLFNSFIISLFRNGFKKKVAMEKMDKIPGEITKTPLEFPAKDFEREKGGRNASKRLKVDGNDINFDSSKLFPTNTNLKLSNYKLLNEYSNSRGIKIIIEGGDIFKSNTNISNKVFFKMFDLANLQNLHAAGMPCYEKEFQKLTESEINILVTLADKPRDFKYILESLKRSYIREVTALKKINQWNSTHGIKNRINSPKLLQYGWTYLELPLEGKSGYAYWGPFICTEYLEFINDNKYKNNPKRIKNLNRQMEILSKAGIDHNDFKKDNFCFNKFDQAFFVDFDQSVIDDNRYLKKYDFQRIHPNEKCI